MIHVSDVTLALNSQTSYKSSTSGKNESTITPFQKVLDGAAKDLNQTAQSDVQAATSTSKTQEVSQTETEQTGSGKVALKAIFKRASEKYDISYDFLVSVAKAESDFNPKCVSSAGAKGIMQMMPYECEELGVTDPFNPEQNIMASAKLLKAHLDKFDGDYTLAAAAYNAGSGAVKKYGGVPPYTETQNYVKKIAKYMEEGVTVPKVKYKVKDVSKYDASQVTETSSKTNETQETSSFDTGEAASQTDLDSLTVTVGTGEDMVTMTYGAYLKYLELGTLGVG